jgi:DNA-directed RNA polymerase II subunit RPB11
VCKISSIPKVLLLTFGPVPHPLFATFELRIQTNGDVKPKDVLVQSCRELVRNLEILSREFTKEYELRKMISGAAAADANGDR